MTNIAGNADFDLRPTTNVLLLKDAFSRHLQATLKLTKVTLELEWTIFTRFTVGVMVATILSVLYLILSLRHTRRPLLIWQKLNKPIIKMFRPRVFGFLLGNMNPYTASIDMTVTTFSKGFCTAFMRDKPSNRNPFKSLHATALATFAESVAELAMHSTLNDDAADVRLLRLHIDFKKKARGLITASTDVHLSTLQDQEGERLPAITEMDVTIKDRTLETVAVAHLAWSIVHRSKD